MIGIGLSGNIATYLLLQAIDWENERRGGLVEERRRYDVQKLGRMQEVWCMTIKEEG